MNQNNTAIAPVATTIATTIAAETTAPAAKTKKTGPARKGRAVVDVKVEAEVKVEATVVETLPEAPKAEAPVVETWVCSITGESRPINKMLVPKLGDLDRKIGHRTTEEDLRKHALSVKGALKNGLNREELMLLDVALEFVRKDDEKATKAKALETERAEKAKKLAAFRASVFIGQPKVGEDGKTYCRCIMGRNCEHAKLKGTAFVGSTDVMQAPTAEEMNEIRWNRKLKGAVTTEILFSDFALCPSCAKRLIEGKALSVDEAIKDLDQNAETFEAEADRLALAASYADAATQFMPRTPRGKGGMKGGKKSGKRHLDD